MQSLSLVRNLLFTPADRPERFGKAPAVGADGAVLDLEDGVGLPSKEKAREAALRFFEAPLSAPADFVWAVRFNHITTEDGLKDLLAFGAAVRRPKVIMLPKTESVSEVEIAVHHLETGAGDAPQIVALIETGRGLGAAEAIAAHPSVVAIAFGGADLAADLHATLAWEPMLFARSRIVQAAAAAGVAALDVPFLDIHDAAGLSKETEMVKALGYSCKLAIHPAQIAPINAVFTPDPKELARAERIVAAFEQAHGGACQVDGRMVDVPVVKAAQRTVALAGRKAA
ncbi:MAG TPA: CoA ester lyase [Burkholderiales bacterium]|nr:CoA ester lyase [Burkholderiales bacterium]